MTSVGDILDYKKKEDEDYYAILGCDSSSTIEQINAEYKVRALQYHPDKNSGDKEAEQKFQLLKEAKEILCDPERRANYDKWRSSGIAISYKQWLGMKEHVHQSMHWSNPKTKDRMLESGGNSGPSSLGAMGTSPAHRRASEGGANLHWGGRGAGSAWGKDPPSEVASSSSHTDGTDTEQNNTAVENFRELTSPSPPPAKKKKIAQLSSMVRQLKEIANSTNSTVVSTSVFN